MAKLTIYCHQLTSQDSISLKKVIAAAESLHESGPIDYAIVTFTKKDVVKLTSSINIVCADFQPVTAGEELVYYWPSPHTFMADLQKKREVWQELSGSVVPMLNAMQSQIELCTASFFKETLTPTIVTKIIEDWKQDNKKMVISDKYGNNIHVYPDQKPGEKKKEITLNELILMMYSLMALRGEFIRVTNKSEC